SIGCSCIGTGGPMFRVVGASAVFIMFFSSNIAIAQQESYQGSTVGPMKNWRKETQENLRLQHGYGGPSHRLSNADVTDVGSRHCVKINNYYCIKFHKSNGGAPIGWNGTQTWDGKGHARFVRGWYSARAAIRNFRTRFRCDGLKNLYALMDQYAPEKD